MSIKKNNNIKICSLVFLITLFILPCSSYGKVFKDTARVKKVYLRQFKDTVHFRKTTLEKKNLVLEDSTLNEIGIDSLLTKIENIHNSLNSIINTTSLGYDTKDIEDNLPNIDSNINIIGESLIRYNGVLDIKNLQMFDVLLLSFQNQLTDWRVLLFKYDKELAEMNSNIISYKKDTILRDLMEDSSFSSAYLNELNDLKSKMDIATQSTNDNQAILKQLLAEVSNQYFESIDLQNKINGVLRKTSARVFSKEYDYLWNIGSKTISESSEQDKLIEQSNKGERKILKYYFMRNWKDQFWMFLAGLIFFLWIIRNINKLKKLSLIEANNNPHNFLFIKSLPILPTLVVIFNIAPFFDIHPPTAYVEIMQSLLVVAVTFLLWKSWSKELFFYWLIMGVFFITYSLADMFLLQGLSFRIFLLVFNILSILLGVLWFKKLKEHTLIFVKMIRIVSIIYILLNATAILCNLFGRISLTKIFSGTAIFGLTQVIALSIFMQIVTEAFKLQMLVNQNKGGINAKLDFHKIQHLLSRALIIISIALWVIVFTISLNIYNSVFSQTLLFLTQKRRIGTTDFEIGNIFIFIFIIYISNLLQNGIGSLYGKDGAWDPEVKKNGSRLAMTRLVLIVCGFLLAVSASGLPIDKITIVLGALGVGIGLGLQSIVNNLVSGVILIFEQPFRIGDYIEITDKKGRVLDIGIRASKILMEDGAEMVISNGDLLSGRVINWTHRNDNVRIDLLFNIDISVSKKTYDELKVIINNELSNSEYVLKTETNEILLSAITTSAMNIIVLVWINNVHESRNTKSLLLNKVYLAFEKNNIKVL